MFLMRSTAKKMRSVMNKFKLYIALSVLPLSHLTPLENVPLEEIKHPNCLRLLEQPNGAANFIYQKEKVTEYSYPINSQQPVNIDNRYGKIKTKKLQKSKKKEKK